MFRYELGAKILVKKYSDPESEAIEVEIIGKAPNMIKALVLSDGWFRRNSTHWLDSKVWFSIERVKEK